MDTTRHPAGRKKEKTVEYQIKNHWTGAVLFTADVPEETESGMVARVALEQAVKADANLAGAYLARANLADANLAGAYLARADLADANLAGAYLARANLADANLAGAYLADAYLADAYLAGADLADANLADARNLPVGTEATSPAEPYQRDTRPAVERNAARAARFRERNPTVPVVEALDAKILSAIENGSGGLEMGAWHTCETTHCRAGWAVHLAGEAGYALEREHGPQYAGRMIYMASVGRAPHFFASNERAMADLREQAAQQTKPVA
ncbi:pentapeptide repeat-containing protein [Bordetella bronchiseptica]|uniref:pentapeptide repeat-containing protein n=1 Tax=Bordetella bronchiseptica TaxID=518 RepID=UPI000A78DAEA|nr:pentapeptide repeat-containing protein [Bordetella bronchiseptica]